MPNITVYNLLSTNQTIPGGYYTGTLPPRGSATFLVPDTDEYLSDTRVQALITGGSISVVHGSDDSVDRPLPIATTATLPTASDVATGTVYWDSTEEALVVSDGSTWVTPVIGESIEVTAGVADIAANRFVGLSATGVAAVSPAANERWMGVSTEAIAATNTGKVQVGGKVEVMPSSAIAAGNELIAAPGGFAAPYQAAIVALGATVAGADAFDDIDQTNIVGGATVAVICAGNETGNTVIVYGNVGGNLTIETITLGVAGTYTSTNTFTAVYCLQTTAASVNTIDIQDGGAVGNLIPQIPVLTAARRYGAIVPSVTTDSEGQHVQVQAGGANASDCVIYGTDYAGTAQGEIVTMNGNNWVESTLAYRSFDYMFIGADGIAWNFGATSQYDQQVEANERNEIRAFALEAEAVAGATVAVLPMKHNTGIEAGRAPMPYHVSSVTYGGGAVSTTATVYGVAPTDVIQATLNAATAAANVIRAEATATNTVTITFDINPGANTRVGLVVWRP